MVRLCILFILVLLAGLFAIRLPQAPADDPVIDAPLPPLEAARRMKVPEGFQVTLFAGEPDVMQPIGFCIDDRGRLWVAEAYNYPNHGTKPGDRIVIFEDANGDGAFDKRTVFYNQLNYVTGIEVGFGGAWVMSPPNFYFIPDRDGDDRPDGPPQVLLDGFGNHANAHNLANGFAWGPDGWLYGTHGRTNWSMLGKPGTPQAERVRYDGGVYRYHPVRHVFEPYADGTTNPWGIDWDDFGEAFICNCVNPHLFHVIAGAHYEPWRNRESSEFAYERIPTIADHLHFVGGNDIRFGLRTPAEDEAGGGHAHCGTMVYLGDNFPEKYRNTIFMNNIHGHRINNDLLKRSGSGYIASHGRDLMVSQDQWFMGVTLQYGPDGSVFVIDWSDTGECHSTKNTRRHTGRIYSISYGKPEVRNTDLAALSNDELVKLQSHRNDWQVRHARRLLQERAAQGQAMNEVHRQLHKQFTEQASVPVKLRALWALQSTSGLTDRFLVDQLQHDSEYVRSWAVRLLCEDRDPPAEALRRFEELATTGKSQLDRLHLASMLQRLPAENRWPIGEALARRGEDSLDANLPLMIWYGIEPLVQDNLQRFIALAGSAKVPLVRRHIARRVTSLADSRVGLNSLIELLQQSEDSQLHLDLLTGILQGLEGRRSVPMPSAWSGAYARLKDSPVEAVRESALQLALVFDDPSALRSLRIVASDDKAAPPTRNRAIAALVSKKVSNLPPLLIELVADPATRNSAIRGLAEFNDDNTPATLLDNYASFDASAKQDALQTLSARSAWAMKLLDAVEANRVPRSDLSAFTARQLQSLKDERLTARVKALWGEIRATPADKARLITNLKRQLSPESLERADRSAGRAIFHKNCANCHKLFDAGGAIGPDITGSQRRNVEYLLENLIDPSAAVSKDYQMQIVQTAGGRIVTGLIVSENANAVTIQTVNEKVVIPVNEIETRETARVSIMPDGVLEKLPIDQVRNLFAYLAGPTQASLPEGAP